MDRAPKPIKPAKASLLFLAIGLFLFALAGFAGIATMVTEAISKVRDGKGFETYRTTWLVEFSYVGFLVLLASIFLALFIVGVLWWMDERQWRALEKKYPLRE